MSDLVKNPDYWFSHAKAHITLCYLFVQATVATEQILQLAGVMHQSFVTTAPPPMGKGGNYDFSVSVPCYEPRHQGANWRSKLCSLPSPSQQKISLG